MKKSLILLAAAALFTLAGCDIVSPDTVDLKGRTDTLEGTTIPTIKEQITSINNTIDILKQFNTAIDQRVEALEADNTANKDEIAKLKTTAEDLQDKIDDLEDYVTDLYTGVQTWAEATFATIQTGDELEARLVALEALDLGGSYKTDLEKLISDAQESVKTWVNEQLLSYTLTADLDKKIADAGKEIKDADDALKSDIEDKIKDVADSIAAAKTEFDNKVKDAIEAVCAAGGVISEAIADQIEDAQQTLQNNIDALKTKVEALETKIAALEKSFAAVLTRIQSIAVVPTYSDGSVRVPGDVRFEILPVSAAKALVALPGVKDSLSFNCLEITDVKMDAAEEFVVVSVTLPEGVSATKDRLKIEAYRGGENYVCKASDYFTLVPTIGTAKAKLNGTDEVDVTWIQLWDGGPKWATINVGVQDASATTESGYYFAWGYTEGCIRNSGNNGWVLASDGTTAKPFSSSNFPDLSESEFQDAATAVWGSGWSMPTITDFSDLLSNCTVEYVTDEGKEGIKVTGKATGYTANSIFLPAAGSGNNSSLDNPGARGHYWSSTQNESFYASYLCFRVEGKESYVGNYSKYCGFPVRAVLNENAISVPVAGITLDQTSATIFTGHTQTLSATVSPSDATNKTLTWSSSNPAVATVDANGVVTAIAAGTATITATATDGSGKTATCTVTVKYLPEGALPGLFSVSSTKKVYFSKGNLYYDGSTDKYHFENSQTAYPTSWDPNHVGHFYYSTKASVAYAKSYSDEEQNDRRGWDIFFTNSERHKPNSSFTVEGQTGVWRILDCHDDYCDWIYLLNSRGSGNKVHRSGVEVAGNHNCLVIAPDGNTVDIKSSYTADEWAAAESAYGFVCLPAAGWRSGSSFTNQDSLGGYLASSPVGNQAHQMYYVSFGSSVNDCAVGSRSYALSVRLVIDVTE